MIDYYILLSNKIKNNMKYPFSYVNVKWERTMSSRKLLRKMMIYKSILSFVCDSVTTIGIQETVILFREFIFWKFWDRQRDMTKFSSTLYRVIRHWRIKKIRSKESRIGLRFNYIFQTYLADKYIRDLIICWSITQS